MISDQELNQFEKDALIKYAITGTQHPIVTIESSKHNEADPYDLMCLQELQVRANETIDKPQKTCYYASHRLKVSATSSL